MGVEAITPDAERRNRWIFVAIQLLIYFSAPVIYVGVVQAAFCERLGASATISNLPSAAALLGAAFPIVCCWFFPTRLERSVLVKSFYIVAFSMLPVCAVVFLPVPAPWRIGVVIAQSFIVGIIGNITNVYTFTCLARGTTADGRAKALKYAFGLGPIAAVLGSVTAQLFLDNRIPRVLYPFNFGMIYLMAFPCMLLCAVMSGRFQLLDVPDAPRRPLVAYLLESMREYKRDRNLVLVWFAYLFWYVAIDATPNISLYAREAVGRAPIELAGVVMAISFGCKAIAGFGLGSFASRYGARRTMNATVFLAGAAMLWPLLSSGYGYLFAFGLMGAGELGGVYFPNYVVDISGVGAATRNLAIISLVGPLTSVAPAIYGGLTDWLGFRCSFLFGILATVISLALLLRLGSEPRSRETDSRTVVTAS